MRYFVTENKKYQYVRVYNLLKKVNENVDPISKAFSSMVDKLLLKKKKTGLQ